MSERATLRSLTGCTDAHCDQDRESKMVTVGKTESGRPIFCDPCIAPIVAALNEGGIRTVWSCCGHGHRLGMIGLADGRQLVIAADHDTAQRIANLFPFDINGDYLAQTEGPPA